MVQPILSHATYIAIGIIAVIMIISTFYSLQSNILDLNLKSNLEYTARTVENKILDFKSMGGSDFEANVMIDGSGLLSLSNNVIKLAKNNIEVNRSVSATMSGEAYLPAHLTYSKNSAVIK